MSTKTPPETSCCQGLSRRNMLLAGTTLAAASALAPSPMTSIGKALAQTGAQKPNILVIWGDDVGVANISAYSNGVMGYETPGIDRIGREGIKFLHYYGEQSCTAVPVYGLETPICAYAAMGIRPS
jgi:hypothetical protein